jgi:hypothetical protein
LNVLTKYDAACFAVSEAVTIDEAKGLRDKGEAMRVYAKQAKNKLLEVQAAEIRIRAERRIGELMAAQRDAGKLAEGHRYTGGSETDPPAQPTLSDAGIDKHLADRARKMAAIPADEFDGIVSDWRERVADENARVTVNLLGAGEKHIHVSANSGNNEWYTPEAIITAARAVLGCIDLDPASSEIANRVVKAKQIFTAESDGLAQEWPIGRIWMNPPYAQPLMGKFASRLAAEVNRGSEAIVLVNNATETNWFQIMAAECSAICFPQSRIKFLDPDGNPGAPLQGQAIIYCGETPDLFAAEFSGFGLVLLHG